MRILAVCLTIAAVLSPLSEAAAQLSQQEAEILAALRQALLADVSQIADGATSDQYEAQFALTIDRYLQNEPSDVAMEPGSESRAGRRCLVVLQALNETANRTGARNVRMAIANLKSSLGTCRGGTGAGSESAGLLFDLPQIQTGGGANYVQ